MECESKGLYHWFVSKVFVIVFQEKGTGIESSNDSEGESESIKANLRNLTK